MFNRRPRQNKRLAAMLAAKGFDPKGLGDEVVIELGGRAIERNPTAREQHKTIAEPGRQRQIVENYDNPGALARGGVEEMHDAKLMQRIQCGDGLVGEQNLGLHRQSARKKHSHTLAARKRRRLRNRNCATSADIIARSTAARRPKAWQAGGAG